jgi:hypothetical protein
MNRGIFMNDVEEANYVIQTAQETIEWHEARAASMAQTHVEEVAGLHEQIGALKELLRQHYHFLIRLDLAQIPVPKVLMRATGEMLWLEGGGDA